MWTHAGVFPWVFEPEFREWLSYVEGEFPNRTFFHSWGSSPLPERPDLSERAIARARGILNFAERQQRELLKVAPQADQAVELYSDSEGWRIVPTRSWVSGFLPASIWLNFHWSGLPLWQTQGERRLDALEVEKNRTTTHDLGFMIGLPFSLAYDLTGNLDYADVLVAAAGSLASRYSPVVGATRSWSHGTWGTGLNFTVIVDNMMNLELLLRASALPGGNADWYDMALTHARTTMRELLREDAGTYHVAIFNSTNGAVISKLTHQGYNDQSTWSRGQAWALYGFALMYEYTDEQDMRTAGKDVATYFIDNLPENGIVPWDFDAPGNEVPTDTSASAVAAAGLLRLAGALGPESTYTQGSLDAAYRMIIGLSKWPFLAVDADYGALLRGGSRARGEYEQSLIYGDYYLLEACQRLLGIFPERLE